MIIQTNSGRVLAKKWDDRSAFTVREAGQILGLGQWAAYQAAATGALPTIRIGRRLIVPRQALERLLAPARP